MNILAIIPARGGSKSIPRKNLALLDDRTLVARTAEVVQRSCLGNALLCTDDEEIMEEGLKEGLWWSGLRPLELAQDDTTTVDVLKYRMNQWGRYDAIMCLQVTNPLRTPEDIDKAVAQYEKYRPDSVISVTPVGDYHPAHMCRVSDSRVTLWTDEARAWGPRQNLDQYYLRDGSIYLTSSRIIKRGRMVGANCRAVIIPPERSLRVDTQADLDRARELLTKNGPK